jgi:hypothetical protein
LLEDDFYEPASLIGSASLEITPGNAAPTVVGDAVTAQQDTTLTIPAATLLANDSDVDGDSLTVQLARDANHGQVNPSTGGFTYTPDAGFYGVDSFAYEACDDDLVCSLAVVTVTVLPASLTPSLSPAATAVTVDEGQVATLSGTTVNYAAIAGYSVSYSASIGEVTDLGGGAWSWSYATSDGPDETGSVTVMADYGIGSTTFDLTVNNVPPTLAPSAPATLPAGDVFSLILGTPVDPGADTISAYHITWGDSSPKEIVSGGPVAHVYSTVGTYTIIIDLVDEDGSHLNAGSTSVEVTPAVGRDVSLVSTAMLHIVDQGKPKTACANGKTSCKLPLESAVVRVFALADLAGLDLPLLDGVNMVTLTADPDGGLYPDIFENVPAVNPSLLAGQCATDTAGSCTTLLQSATDYLVIVRYDDGGGAVYTGRPLDAASFVDTDGNGDPDLAMAEYQVIKFYKKDGSVQYGGGSKTVFVGSVLEIIAPDYAVWEEGVTNLVYPFIFLSDSDWSIDICAEVPQGYAIVGVYDDDGNLVTSDNCYQTIVANESQVVAFEVIDMQSPRPDLKVGLKIRHNGRLERATLETPGHRLGIDNPGQNRRPIVPPSQSNEPGGQVELPQLPLAFASMGLVGIAFTRRRRR